MPLISPNEPLISVDPFRTSRPRILVPIPYLPETWGELYDLMERFWNTNRDKIAREEKA